MSSHTSRPVDGAISEVSEGSGCGSASYPLDGLAVAELRLRQQRLCTSFAASALRDIDFGCLLKEACRIAADGMGCTFAKVLEFQPDENRFLVRAGVGWLPGTVGHAHVGSDLDSPAGYAFRTGMPVLSNVLGAESRFSVPAILREHGIQRAFNVLIHTASRRYGVLEVNGVESRDFDLAETAFLENLAAVLGHVVARQERADSQSRDGEFTRAVLQASPDCAKILALDGRIEAVNDRYLAAIDVSDPKRVIGCLWEEFVPEEQRGSIRAAVLAAANGDTVRIEAHYPAPSGDSRWYDVVVAPISIGGGNDRKLVSVSREVTERVVSSEAKDLLILEIHHRVKNSLQLVQNLLSMQARAAENAHAIEQLNESAARVRTIAAIHDRLYKTNAALTVEVRPYLEGLVEDFRTGMASTLRDRNVTVVADDVTWAASDMPTLGVVMTELATNALKYGSGTVDIVYRQPLGSNGTLSVTDRGPGPPAGFSPQASRGLGMRLIQGLLRGAGAGLDVERVDECTRFTARFPAPKGIHLGDI